jgi:hypothetical protein
MFLVKRDGVAKLADVMVNDVTKILIKYNKQWEKLETKALSEIRTRDRNAVEAKRAGKEKQHPESGGS